MRPLFAAALFGAAVTGAACGQEPKKPVAEQPPAKAAVAKLSIGDPAPPLKVTKWLQGEEVKGFEKDKVYVIEFWATWCGPCIGVMPHLKELQDQYRAKGLVVIGLTSKDERGNDQKAVEEFVAKNGKKFDYRFAYCDNLDTDKAYLEASGQDGIPFSFVVGKDGKIAFFGHPLELDEVLPQVLDGSWKGKASLDAIAAARDDLGELFQFVGKAEEEMKFDAAFAAAALTKLNAFEAKHPAAAGKNDAATLRLLLTLKAGQFDAAKAAAEVMLKAAETKKKGDSASMAGQIIADKNLNPDKKLIELAVRGAETAMKLEKTSVMFALRAVNVYIAAGKKAEAEAAGKQAIENATAEGDEAKKQVTEVVHKLLTADKK